MISIEGLTVEFGGFTLLDKITYVINKKDRIALVGKNGAGKSNHAQNHSGASTAVGGVGKYAQRYNHWVFAATNATFR